MPRQSLHGPRKHASLALASLLAGLAGCTGNLLGTEGAPSAKRAGDPATHGDPGTPGGTGTDIGSLKCDPNRIDPGPSPLRLLSRAQYLNTVRDLAGEVPGLEAALGPANDASAFGLLQPDVTQVELEHFQAAANLIAAAIVGSPDALAKIAPCATSAVPVDCARTLVERFGALAYRAPLVEAEDVERHVQLFSTGQATSYAHGVELLLRGMLQSPRFLYRVEIGTGEQVSDRAVKLSPHELAARLSYTVWDSLPDAQLNEAIATGALNSKAGVSAQLAWMLAEPRGAKLVNRFLLSLTQLQGLGQVVKDASLFPEWQSESFAASLTGQAQAFFEHVLRAQGGKLSALFTSQTIFYNQDLAGYYGVSGGAAFESLERADGTASGMLTLPGWLALQAKPAESSPIYRGRFVREALLCQQLPAPPANVPKPPEVDPTSSTRDRLAQHEVNPACSGCHQLLDPIGLGFENFDALGRYRETDGGKSVDASGLLVQTRDIDGAFVGVAELGAKLAKSSEVEDCLARQWFRYAVARFEQDMDACSMQSLLSVFQASGQDLNALPRAVVETDAFLYRRPIEVLP